MVNSSSSRSSSSRNRISNLSQRSASSPDKPLPDFLLEPGLPEFNRKELKKLREVPQFQELTALFRRRLKRAHERLLAGYMEYLPLVRELMAICNYLEGRSWIQGHDEVPESE